MEREFEVLFGILIFAGLLCSWCWALVWQRRRLPTQQYAVSHVEESLELSRETVDLARRSVELSEQANALLEENVRYQREIVEVLRRLEGRGASESSIRA